MCSSNPTPGHVSRENHELKGYMHPNIHAALLTIAKTWKLPKCLLTEDWIRIWYVYTNGILLSDKEQ